MLQKSLPLPISIVPVLGVVSELFLNVLLLLIREELDLLLGVSEPFMVVNLLGVQSLLWVFFEQTFYKIPSLFRYVILHSVLGLQDQFLQLAHVVCLKRNCTIKHRIEDYSN